MMRSDRFVSVVAPVRDGGGRIGPFLDDVARLLARHFELWEIVLVDDGSRDATVLEVEERLEKIPNVRLLRLSRPFGVETAILAGLEAAIGDFVVVMRPAHDPPQEIPAMVERAVGGADIVAGVLPDDVPDFWFARVGSRLFHAYAGRVLGVEAPRRGTDFRVLSRRAVNALVRIKDRLRHFRMHGALVGFATEEHPYRPLPDAPRTRTLAERAALAVGVVVAGTTHPLRLVSLGGLFAAGLNVAYAIYVIVVYIVKEDVAPGWATLSLTSSAMFFLLFLALAVLSEYVGRILLEIRTAPQYWILEERVSNVMDARRERENVVHSADSGTFEVQDRS